MSRAGEFDLTVEYSQFAKGLEAAVSRIQTGTKRATIAACEEIKKQSQDEVPEHTGALRDSFFYEIHGSYRNFTATMGYGGPGSYNTETGQSPSEYMVAVHEDLEARHPKGKAKFLEDPINDYQRRMLGHTGEIIGEELK